MTKSRKIAIALLALLTAGGIALAAVRFNRGLGAVTALTDGVPWGLWIAVKLCFIAVAAGAFCLAAATYILKLERYRPLTRPAVLTGLVFYTLFVLALMLDLGMPLRFWHPVVMWQRHSVLFEVSWCVMLYTSVLAAEISPALWERLRMQRMRRWVKAAIIPLVIAGVVLSVLHQSSLGGLFLILPHRLHPLWHSPLLPVHFLLSAMGAGLSTVILIAAATSKLRAQPAPTALTNGLAKAAGWVLILYGLVRLGDLAIRGGMRSGPSGYAVFFITEVVLGIAIPVAVFSLNALRTRTGLLLAACGSAVAGTCLNRFNVSLLGIIPPEGATYVPTWMEAGLVLGLLSLAALIFIAATRYLPIFEVSSGPADG